MDHYASMDTKFFRTELSQKRRFLLKIIESVVDQTKETRENHLPVERELSSVDAMNLKRQHPLSSWCTCRVHNGFISGYKISPDDARYSTSFQHSATFLSHLDRKKSLNEATIKAMKLALLTSSCNGKYYQKLVLSF